MIFSPLNIALIPVFLGLATLIFKVWTDWQDRKEKLFYELRQKRIDRYIKFFDSFTNFANNINDFEAKKEFLQLCYEMILIAENNLSTSVEELLDSILKYTENSEVSSQKSLLLSLDERMGEDFFNKVIIEMKKDLKITNARENIIVDWLQAIEFLTTNIELSQIDELNQINYFWINANTRHVGHEPWKQMLQQNIACTYGPSTYGERLKQIHKNDIVFLYVSGVGIINYGTVLTEYNGARNFPEKTTGDGSPEYNIGVQWEINQSEPRIKVSANEIRKLGHALFIPTVVGLSHSVGEKIKQELNSKKSSQL